MNDEAVKPEVVEEAAADEGQDEEQQREAISHPTKLIRIASMTRAMLEEVRQAPLDERGRARLAEVHSQTLSELREVLSDDLQEEFDQVMMPIEGEGATEAEIRVAQAQLIGWLEGLFHGIQATLFSQQVAAQSQLAEMQRRALGRSQEQKPEDRSGMYL
jgi:DNA-directed RNA polymerase subunit F